MRPALVVLAAVWLMSCRLTSAGNDASNRCIGPEDCGGADCINGMCASPDAAADGAALPDAAADGTPDAAAIVCAPGCTSIADGTLCFCSLQADWMGARQACADADLVLASVRSQADNDAVADAQVAANSGFAWLGGSDAAVEGDFRWLDGDLFWMGGQGGSAPAGAYQNFLVGEPNDAQMGEDCLVSTPNGWNDGPCGNIAAFVCGLPR